MGARVLLVNDVGEGDLLSALRDRGYAVDCVRSLVAARAALDEHAYDVVVLDSAVSTNDRLEIVESHGPTSMVVLGEAPSAPASHHRLTWVARPPSFAELIAQVDRAITDRLARASSLPPGLLHGEELAPLLERAALLEGAPYAFLWGESGVGKDVLATWLHRRRALGSRPYVHVNLAAIPSAMIRSELLGTSGERNSSFERSDGHVVVARGGTLVLDDVAELALDVQHDLVSALEVTVERTSLIALGRSSPEDLLARGLMHPDLYERMSQRSVRLPPLRERPTEILLLARHFLDRFARALDRPALRFSSEAEAALASYDFPGNVRELRNVVERAVLTAADPLVEADELDLGQLEPRDGPSPQRTSYLREISATSTRTVAFPAIVDGEGDGSLRLGSAKKQALDGFEKNHIATVMKRAGGSRTRAAQLLGISRSTLWEKLRKYRLE